MNGNLKALKKILFILQKSYSGLEHKLVIWDYLKTASRKQPGSLQLLPLEQAKLVRLGQTKPKSRAGRPLGHLQHGHEKWFFFFFFNTKPGKKKKKKHLQQSKRA